MLQVAKMTFLTRLSQKHVSKISISFTNKVSESKFKVKLADFSFLHPRR